MFFIALVPRLAPVLLAPDLGIGLDDMFQYDMLARSLAAGDGYRWYAAADLEVFSQALEQFIDFDREALLESADPRGLLTSFRAPAYPFFLSLIYRMVDSSDRLFAARIVQAFIGASLAPITLAIAIVLGVRRRLAAVAAVLVSTWPMLVALPLSLATENLFIPLLAAATLLLLRDQSRLNGARQVVAGLLLGLTTLTRSVIIGFPGLLSLDAFRRRRWRAGLLLLLPIVLITAPWAVRNTLLHQRLTFVESSLGYNLYLGYHPQGDGAFLFGPSLDLLTILDDAERDRAGRDLAMQFIRDDPLRLPRLTLAKLGHFWGLEDRAFVFLYSNGLFGPLPPPVVLAGLVLLSLPLALTLPWAALGWLRAVGEPGWRVVTLLLGWYVGVHMLILADARFHLALVPLMAAYAGRGLQAWPQFRRALVNGDSRARKQAAVLILVIGLAVLNWGSAIAANASRYATLLSPAGWQSNLPY